MNASAHPFQEDGATAQMGDSPRRRYATSGDLGRALAIDDLRARTHRLMPRFVLEYLEGGAGAEETLTREREAYREWLFMPHTLVDESHRDLARHIIGKSAKMPLLVGPTGLNGLFRHGADMSLAIASAKFGVPFIQSTMSNERMEDIAEVKGLRHWWQLYLFGPDEIWQSLVDRADACCCEALVLTTNSQIFGERLWSSRTRIDGGRPSVTTIMDAACHPRWLATTLNHGMPQFANVIDYVPKDKRGFFESAFWIREQMPKTLSWKDVAKIRKRWKKPLFIKGILNLQDVTRSLTSGVDGIILGSHGGRQADASVSALDILPRARDLVGDHVSLFMSGGIRTGSHLLKALALGADAIIAGRAPLYGLCAGGRAGVSRALQILHDDALNELGQLGVSSLDKLGADILVRRRQLPLAAGEGP